MCIPTTEKVFGSTLAALKKVNWEKVVTQETLNPINWKFIAKESAGLSLGWKNSAPVETAV